MKQIVTILTLLLGWSFFAQAQFVDYSGRLGGNGNASIADIVRDAAGNYYLTGGFTLTMDANPGVGVNNLTAAGSTDMFVIKVSAQGDYLWSFKVGGQWTENAQDLSLDAAGNLVIVGRFSGTVDFDPSAAGVANLSSKGSPGSRDAIFWVRYSPDGNYLSSFQIAPTGNVFFYADAGVDAQGNYYLAGSFNGTMDVDPGPDSVKLTSGINNDPFFCKISATGRLCWAKKLSGGLSFTINDVEVVGNGMYISHNFNSQWDVNPSLAPADTFVIRSKGNTDIGLLKLDTSGQFMWARTIGSSGDDNGLRMSSLPDGRVVFCGNWQNMADFDPGPGIDNRIALGAGDGFLMAMNPDGTRSWVQLVAGAGLDYSQRVSVNAQGQMVLQGTFQSGNLSLGSGSGAINLSPNGSDGYAALFGSDGSFIRAFGYTGNGSQAGSGATFDDAGNPIVYGSFQNSLSLSPNPGNFQFTGGSTATDAFILQIVPNPVGVEPTILSEGFLYPNPARTFLQLPATAKEVQAVQVIDAQGRMQVLESRQGQIQVEALRPGLYQLIWLEGEVRRVGRFLRE